MHTLVSSKFAFGFWTRHIAITAMVFSLPFQIIYSNKVEPSPFSIPLTILFPILGIYIYLIIKDFRQIIVAPEGLIFNYVIINKKIIIEYENIVTIKNLRVESFKGVAYFNIEIEMANGQVYYINENLIDNYEEIRLAIRQERYLINYRNVQLTDSDGQKAIAM